MVIPLYILEDLEELIILKRAKVLAKEATYDKQLNDLKRNIKVMIK